MTHTSVSTRQTYRSGGTGQIITTDRALSRGGEGTVFSLVGDQASVAKIYKSAKRTPWQTEKLSVMVKNPPVDKARKQLTPAH